MERKVREENSGRERIVNMPERTRERLCDSDNKASTK